MKKGLSLISLLLAAGMLFTACNNKTPTTSQPSNLSGGSSQVTSNEPITITMVESLTSPDRTAIIREIADKFEAQNKNVTVEIISPPLEGADQKISQMLQAKEKVDIVEVRDNTVKMMANNSWLMPLNSYIDNWDEKDTLSESAHVAMNMLGDDIYMIPYGFYEWILFYRLDWFKEAGLEAPVTWEDVYEAGKILTNPDQNRYGYSYRGGSGGVDHYDMRMIEYVGEDALADMFNAYYMKDGTTIFADSRAAEALEFQKKLYEEISPKDSIAWGFPEMVQAFIGGTTAMMIQSPEVIISCQESMEDGEWAVAPRPQGPNGVGLSPAGYAGWGITSHSKNPDIAAKFLLFLSNAENNTYFDKEYSMPPIHTTASELDPVFVEGPLSVFAKMNAEPDHYKLALVPQGFAAYAKYRSTADQWYQKYLVGEITLEECLQYSDEYWTEALQEEGKPWEK